MGDPCRLSVLPVSLFGKMESGEITLQEWLRRAKGMGLDAADISMVLLKNHTPVYLDRVKKMIHQIGIPIAMASTYPDFTHSDALQRERELAYLRNDIAVGSALGMDYIRVLAGQAHPETTREEGIRWAIEMLRRAAVTAAAFHVTLVYEDHFKPSAWEYADFSYPVDIFLEIARGLKGSGVKLNFDTGNITSQGGDPLEVLREVYEDVATVHISDMAAKGSFAPVVIGTGATPNAEILAFLKKNGFHGLVCIEEASNTGFDGIEKAVRFVRSAWEAA
ncbi:MAG: sugar phosphate isomerase/epimerase [Butyricicoccus pullicaecorum]|nr:sugar phosphate isomerase/epimerase [Butyricicoccus pullicaecorum]